MRIKCLLIFLILSLLVISLPLYASDIESKQNIVQPISEDVTGYSWLKMNDAEQLDYGMTGLDIPNNHCVEHEGLPNGYVEAIARKLDESPSLYGANLTDILASVIYENEPESREVLDGISKRVVHKIAMH